MKKVPTRKKKEVIAAEAGEPVQPEINAFSFVTSINYSKEDIIRDSDNPEATEKLYSPYLTNHSLSFHASTLFDANMLNQAAHLPNQLQFDCLRALVRREKRFSKWFKPILEDEIKLVQEVYSCSHRRAIEIRNLLSSEQLKQLAESRFTGGK